MGDIFAKLYDGVQKRISHWHKYRNMSEKTFFLPIENRSTSEKSNLAVGKKILIVDDDPISTKLIHSCLRQEGCFTKMVSDEGNAKNELLLHEYDLVILDWNLTHSNAGQLVQSIQSAIYSEAEDLLWRKKRTPIAIYSSSSKQDTKLQETMAFYPVGYLAKSYPYRELKTQMKKILRLALAS